MLDQNGLLLLTLFNCSTDNHNLYYVFHELCSSSMDVVGAHEGVKGKGKLSTNTQLMLNPMNVTLWCGDGGRLLVKHSAS